MKKVFELAEVMQKVKIHRFKDGVYEIESLSAKYCPPVVGVYDTDKRELEFYLDVRNDEIYNREVKIDMEAVETIKEFVDKIENYDKR